MSAGSEALGEILRKEFRSTFIQSEYPIKIGRATLYLDFYLPTLKLAFEYDGEQHAAYSSHFHGNRQGFEHSKLRDRLKDSWCRDNGVTLIRINHKEQVTKDLIRRKIIESVNT
jgi:very-short-patch-repair endonuclease